MGARSARCFLLRPFGAALLAAIATQYAAPAAHAIDEIQVYNAEIAPPRTFTLQQHLNYVWSGSTTPDFEGGFAPYHSLNGTPELACGVTDWYEIGIYAPFAIDSSGTFLPGGFKFRHLFVSPHAEQRKLFYGLNIELSYQSPRFAQSAFGLELRPILGVRFRLGIHNQPDRRCQLRSEWLDSLRAGSAARPRHRRRRDAGRRILYDLGPLGNFAAMQGQRHNLFGVIDFKAFGLDVNFGLGFGLTDASDKIITKLIVGRAF